MRGIGTTSFFSSSRGTGRALLVILLCICVLSQMLGTPVTLVGLLTSSIPAESVSEDFSIPPITPEPELASRSGLRDLRLSSSSNVVLFITLVRLWYAGE